MVIQDGIAWRCVRLLSKEGTCSPFFMNLTGDKMNNSWNQPNPTLQDKINTLTRANVKLEEKIEQKCKLVDECRELLKRTEEENIRLKETIKSMVNDNPKTMLKGKVRKLISYVEGLKIQSPIVKK